MRTFANITGDLEILSCPSLLSLWGSIDAALIKGPSEEELAKFINLVFHLHSSRPAASVALMKLLLLRPQTSTATGTSFGSMFG